MNRTQIFKSLSDFLTREDKSINGVNLAFSKMQPNWDADNLTNQGCWNCHSCTNCLRAISCYNCKHCAYDEFASCIDRSKFFA